MVQLPEDADLPLNILGLGAFPAAPAPLPDELGGESLSGLPVYGPPDHGEMTAGEERRRIN